MQTKHLNADKMQTNRKERMAELIKKYTGKFQALWDNYFWAKEQIDILLNYLII